jgi:hypothetical protein
MKTGASPSLNPVQAFEQFLKASSFERHPRESYEEDVAPLFVE